MEKPPLEDFKKTKFVIFNFLRTGVFEASLIFFLLILMLATFNYYNLIPLSQTFSFLAFLPQKGGQAGLTNSEISFFKNNLVNLSSCNPITNDISLNNVVECDKPIKTLNNKNKVMYTTVPNSEVLGTNGIQINLAIGVNAGTTRNRCGVILGGGPDKNRIFISYDLSGQWGVIFLYKNKVMDFIPIYSPSTSYPLLANFSIRVSKDGKTIAILSPDGIIHIFNLEDSVFDNGTIPATVVTAPNSSVTLYQLNYYTP